MERRSSSQESMVSKYKEKASSLEAQLAEVLQARKHLESDVASKDGELQRMEVFLLLSSTFYALFRAFLFSISTLKTPLECVTVRKKKESFAPPSQSDIQMLGQKLDQKRELFESCEEAMREARSKLLETRESNERLQEECRGLKFKLQMQGESGSSAKWVILPRFHGGSSYLLSWHLRCALMFSLLVCHRPHVEETFLLRQRESLEAVERMLALTQQQHRADCQQLRMELADKNSQLGKLEERFELQRQTYAAELESVQERAAAEQVSWKRSIDEFRKRQTSLEAEVAWMLRLTVPETHNNDKNNEEEGKLIGSPQMYFSSPFLTPATCHPTDRRSTMQAAPGGGQGQVSCANNANENRQGAAGPGQNTHQNPLLLGRNWRGVWTWNSVFSILPPAGMVTG